ncbi:cellulase family glycosylhydrolase [Saccharophagus degradans]|uniref:Cellulase family glycosylhydrolase n=1 Tax=Saccharophagus degradans TaxID=86304 RepID=A0AAW7XD66_9GAMM|nr:cellulase family glycosylhydrolase [Saccharophagus degradans]MDO6424703.1 cellulase family glycosylhydrolase [Saccharophagus degradans]MDO6609036.1 cellulase family glycosylhydrolase [Saccharophagus degradans]
MKRKLNYLALVASTLLFVGCGGDNLLNDAGNDIDPMLPAPDTEIPDDRPYPPADAAVITTTDSQILDVSGAPVLLRGINLQYGDNPLVRYDAIEPIAEVGSNVVRLQLRETTTADELEAALGKVVEQNMIAMVMFWEEEGKITCTEDDEYLFEKVEELWLDEWIPVLAQRRFQGHLMINIANEWGPLNIWNANSTGYSGYIDTYKILIRKFRQAGFKVPLVIDAPHCGQDHNAFLGGRGRELMAADDEKNLVLSVHAYGARWNSSNEIIRAMGQLKAEKVPVVFGEFGGSGVMGAESIDHLDLIRIGAGERAMFFDIPWGADNDKAAFVKMLDAPLNLNNATISFDLFADDDFVDDGNLAIVVYLKDANWNYANLGWNQANSWTGDSWNTIRYSLSDASSIGGYVSEGFNLAQVQQIGFELVANGKPVDVNANIKIDNLVISSGGVSGPMYSEDFNADTGSWGSAWGAPVTLTQVDSSLSVAPQWSGDATDLALSMNALGSIDPGIDFSQELTITANIYLPAEYASEADLFIKFFGQFGEDWGGWADTNTLGAGDFTAGAWNEVVFTGNFSASADVSVVQRFGMQLGGVSTSKSEAILIDSLVVEGPPEEAPTATQFIATFDSDVDGYESLSASWDSAEVVLASVDGALSVTPDWSSRDQVALNRANIVAEDEIDFSGPITIKADVFLPAGYADSGLWFQFFLQDGNWTPFTVPGFNISNFAPGDWASIEVTVSEFPEGFDTALKPQMFGIQWGGATVDGAVLIDNVEIIGVTEDTEAEVVLAIDFAEEQEVADFGFDYAEGSLTEELLSEARIWAYGTEPFGWLAWSWKGNGVGFEALDMSSEEDAVALTQRGTDLVDGEHGILLTGQSANFGAEEVE